LGQQLISDPAPAVLKRELDNIKELHDAEPDSKWCMNSLAHYLLVSARLPATPAADAAALRADAKAILERLAVIDSDRKERYHELGACMSSGTADPAANQQ
jgi:geranylgeranyl transferase type-2 subunit alpha